MAARYEVTATKYRPKTFDELAGQEFVVSTIKNSLKNGHIANAYLFSGPRGCGKTSAARILARSLNCEKGAEAGPCDGNDANGEAMCDNCRLISQGKSMDVIEIDGASNNKVDQARQIKEEVLFPPQAGRYKVYIIDEVHMLTKEAFNALLKTIEEPPPYICFIFATTELYKVPATIKSRCQQFNFRLIPYETIQASLKKICDDNGIKAESDALFLIARESTGSMREAFNLLDQVVSFSDGNITGGLIREKLGIAGLEKINALADACVVNDAPAAFSLIDEILASGVDIERFIIDLTGYYRSLLLIKNGIVKESLLDYRRELFSTKPLEALDSIRLEQAMDLLLDCYRNIRYSVSPRFELENVISKLTWLSKWISPVELKQAINNAHDVLTLPAGAAGQSGVMRSGVNVSGAAQAANAVSNQGAMSHNERTAADIADNIKLSSEGSFSLLKAFDQITKGVASADDEDDTPMWDRAIKKEETENPVQVKQVLSIIPGSVVS